MYSISFFMDSEKYLMDVWMQKWLTTSNSNIQILFILDIIKDFLDFLRQKNMFCFVLPYIAYPTLKIAYIYDFKIKRRYHLEKNKVKNNFFGYCLRSRDFSLFKMFLNSIFSLWKLFIIVFSPKHYDFLN